MIWSPITNPDRVLDGSMDHPCICPAIGWYMFPKKSSKLINKNNKLRKKSLKTKLSWTSKLGYPWVVAPFSKSHHFRCEFLQKKKNSIGLGLCLRTVAYKRELLFVKYFHIKQHFKKMYVIKKNINIHFACKMKGMNPLVYVVIEPWISMFCFFAPDRGHCTKNIDITC